MHNQSPESPIPSPLRSLLRTVGSLRLALVLIAMYAAALVVGTAVEKQSGTAAAQTYIYHAWWFVVLNIELGVNILAAVLARFPWKLKQTGFVVAHLGVVVLLIGCLLSWLLGSKAYLPVIEGQTSRMVYDESRPDAEPIELGFQVHLRKFRRKLDPGSAMASHYSSLVDFLDGDDPPKVLRDNVLITLNAPVDFTDPKTGRTYRLFQSSFDGPFTPGEPMFAHLTNNGRERDHVYRSVLSVNSDPGRWWKYAGSLMIVVGIVLVYYVRLGRKGGTSLSAAKGVAVCGTTPFAALRDVPPATTILGIACMLTALLASSAQAEGTQPLDWGRWRGLPTFGEGRVEPLDTFSRKTVEAICGSNNPTLTGPDGRRRKYEAAELLFAWLAEPEIWENIPFIKASDPWLRGDVLKLPPDDDRGMLFVSPKEIDNNPGLQQYKAAIQRRSYEEGAKFKLNDEDRKVGRMLDAYSRYRDLFFGAEPWKIKPLRFNARAESVGVVCRKLITDRRCIQLIAKNQQIRDATVEVVQARRDLIDLFHEKGFSRAKIEPAVAALRKAAEKLADLLDDEDKPLAGLAAELRREAFEMYTALYDNGDVLRLVPSLNPAALEENRKQTDDASPWLSFQAMTIGTDDLLRGYPRPELDAVRTALAEVKAAYIDRQTPDRPTKFAEAMDRFADALRSLAERVEPLRRELPLLHRDQSLFDATAYPPPGATSTEVFYNRLDPFFWAWIVGLVASLFFLAAVGELRQPAFWLGAATLLVSLGLVLTGLCLRTYITGLAPLTGMFESVVVVAVFVYVLGLWLALWPCIGISRQAGQADVPSAAKRLTVVELILRRRLFALSGAIVGTLALALSYYAPATVMQRNIGAAVPILRDNFWLVVHVVTIMAGYASAAIALILGNIALGYYLLGRYVAQPPSAVNPTHTAEGGCATCRPPSACAKLADFIYTAVKVTVLLLTAGTILGALWADKSWGRFWGWDPKEVWALVSLLVYLWFLHARHIGLSGDFGMAVTAVLGATVILFNWYGVNFILGIGLHAYATGAGGQLYVTVAVALQWLFMAMAAIRYLIEKQRSLSQ